MPSGKWQSDTMVLRSEPSAFIEWMRPAFSSRTKRRGATALALRLFFLTASDMWHPYGDLTRNWSALDRDYAANSCHDIEWDDRRWNDCASHRCRPVRLVPGAHLYISYAQEILASVYDRFTKGFCRRGHVCRCSLYVIALVGGIERTKLQIGARPDKRRNAR